MQNLSPKEKAEEIYEKFYLVEGSLGFSNMTTHEAIECALIHVDYILDIYKSDSNVEKYKYWVQVRQEIEKI